MGDKGPKPYLYVLTTLFLLAAMTFGYIEAVRDVQGTEQFLERTLAPLQFLSDQSAIVMFLLILVNNAIKALLAVALGFFFGLVPIYMAFVNGRLIGMVAALTGNKLGASVALAGLAPHGILEVPAFIIAITYGIWLGIRFIRSMSGQETFKNDFALAINPYVRIVLPLLVVAALIEAFVTPVIISAMHR